ncbi:DUF167 domain-containing protein [Novosphingobium resinovorum]|uniref:DUF167 domain-containing protein n=1 Tax=Novosphingobium resinovorum TaxID=158500 RepID=UPI002ED26561|nr:DUF167 domain-containing protein [Novosphingobium resinovorum]
MARPKAALPDAGALRALIDADGALALRVTPGAKVEALEIAGNRLTAKVRAQPEGGKANAAVRDLLARALGVAPSRLELLRGATSREKQFRVN